MPPLQQIGHSSTSDQTSPPLKASSTRETLSRDLFKNGALPQQSEPLQRRSAKLKKFAQVKAFSFEYLKDLERKTTTFSCKNKSITSSLYNVYQDRNSSIGYTRLQNKKCQSLNNSPQHKSNLNQKTKPLVSQINSLTEKTGQNCVDINVPLKCEKRVLSLNKASKKISSNLHTTIIITLKKCRTVSSSESEGDSHEENTYAEIIFPEVGKTATDENNFSFPKTEQFNSLKFCSECCDDNKTADYNKKFTDLCENFKSSKCSNSADNKQFIKKCEGLSNNLYNNNSYISQTENCSKSDYSYGSSFSCIPFPSCTSITSRLLDTCPESDAPNNNFPPKSCDDHDDNSLLDKKLSAGRNSASENLTVISHVGSLNRFNNLYELSHENKFRLKRNPVRSLYNFPKLPKTIIIPPARSQTISNVIPDNNIPDCMLETQLNDNDIQNDTEHTISAVGYRIDNAQSPSCEKPLNLCSNFNSKTCLPGRRKSNLKERKLSSPQSDGHSGSRTKKVVKLSMAIDRDDLAEESSTTANAASKNTTVEGGSNFLQVETTYNSIEKFNQLDLNTSFENNDDRADTREDFGLTQWRVPSELTHSSPSPERGVFRNMLNRLTR